MHDFLLGGVLPSLIAQTFTEQKNTYPLSADGSKYVVNGFIPFSPMNDESIYANALLWTIKNVCSAQRDGITEVSIPAKSFSCNLVLTSQADAKQKNTYYCTAQFQVKDGKLVYYLSNIQIESSVVIMKKVTPMEKLQPEKKPSHQETMDDFVQIESQMLNKLFDFVSTNQLSPITTNNLRIKWRSAMDVFQLFLSFFQKRVRGNDYKIKKRSNPEIASRVLSSFY